MNLLQTIITVCAWCTMKIQSVKAEDEKYVLFSHGMCPECFKRVNGEVEKQFKGDEPSRKDW